MSKVNILEAKTHLSRLVEAVESGAEKEIVIARNGKPAAKLVPLEEKPKKRKLGLAAGKYPPSRLRKSMLSMRKLQKCSRRDQSSRLRMHESPSRHPCRGLGVQ